MYLYDESMDFMECNECVHKDTTLAEIRYWFTALTDELYGNGEPNLEDVERFLDEMAGQLNFKLPPGKLQIQTQSVVDPIEHWKSLNNIYIKSLTSSGV